MVGGGEGEMARDRRGYKWAQGRGRFEVGEWVNGGGDDNSIKLSYLLFAAIILRMQRSIQNQISEYPC
jgi:hypothetical protein